MGKFFKELDTLEIIAVLALVLGILYALYKIGSSVSTASSSLWNGISNALSGITSAISSPLAAIGIDTGIGTWGIVGGQDTSAIPASDEAPEVPGG
jgi:hypothetical protein